MSQSPSLNFGPAWMRPTPSRGGSQEASVPSTSKSTKTWDQDQQYIPNTFSDVPFQQQQSSFATQPESTTSNSRVYTIDELLAVWSQIQDKITNGESVESYRSLQPIQELIEQIDRDRSFQGSLSKQDDPQVAEIIGKVDDFTRWAKNDPTTSATNPVSNPSISRLNTGRLNTDTATASPFLNNSSLLSGGTDQSLNSPYGNGGASAFAQPSLNNLLQPSQIKWFYLDPSNNQQGPFDGVSMHSWFIGGYLTYDLHIRREDEFSFYPLQQFITSINNQYTPFLTPLPNLSPQAAPFQHSLSFDQQLPHLFNQSMSLQQPQAQTGFGHLQNDQQNWLGSTSGRSSPWVSQTNLTKDTVSAQDFRIGSQSPFVNQAFTNQNASTSLSTATTIADNNATSTNAPAHTQDDDILNQINNEVLDNVLKEEAPVSTEQSAPQTETKAQQVAPKQEQQKVKESTTSTSTSASKPTTTKASTASAQKQPTSSSAAIPEAKTTSVSEAAAAEASKVSNTEQTKPSAPKLAPWANKSVSNAPQLTLEQIQRLEAEESAKQTKAKAKQDKLAAAQLLANTEKSIKDSEAPKTILPSTSSWGTPVKNLSAPSKTLLDIQREEEEAAAAAAAAAAAVSAAANASNGSSSQSSTPLKNPIVASKNSFASIATSSVPTTNAWTTVSSNRKPVTKTQPPKITSTVKPVTPEILRSVSSSTAAQIQPTTQVYKTVSPRQEFLNWCRTSMKLNKGINKDEVLQVLLMLPVGAEAAEIVADTIYSNSSTMDGRRFAQEFMKRRKAVEDQAQDGLSWDDALRISADNDDDGWDFQVVGKKKKGKN